MSLFEVRSAIATDLSHLMGMDHSCTSDYVWQLELRREQGQVTANFREVRLPRSIKVEYPRNPLSLADARTRCDIMLVASEPDELVGYICASEQRAFLLAWVTDLVVAPGWRRKGAASTLLSAIQAWALERGMRRVILETQSKNQAMIRLAQKFGYEFCGYNDQYYPTQDVALFFGRALK